MKRALHIQDVKGYLHIMGMGGTDFRWLWAAQGVSAVGSQVSALALPLAAAVTLDAGPVALGVLSAATTAPYLALGLPAGVWIDRARRRRPLLVVADLVAAAALLTVPAAVLLGVLSVPLLVAVAMVVGSAQVLHRVAFMAHLPDVVGEASILAASSRLRSTESGAQITGPGLAGALVAAVGAGGAVVVDALSFLLSAACLGRVQAPERPGVVPAGRRGLRREVREGLAVVGGDARLRAIAGSAANLNFAGLACYALLVLFAVDELGLTPATLGLVLATGGVGALAGALTAPALASRLGAGRLVVLSTAGFSLCLAAVPLAGGSTWAAVTVLGANELFGGFFVMLFDTTIGSIVVAATPRELLGRVWATMGFLTQSAKPLGALAGGALGATIGLRPALAVAALTATTCLAWTWWSPLRTDGPLARVTGN